MIKDNVQSTKYKLRIALCGTLLALLVASDAAAQKLVIFVRHAERADGGSNSPTAQTDPLLSAEGEARAKRLAAVFADAGITAIYATEYKRTQDTAKPIAAKLGLPIKTMKAADTAVLVEKLKAEHKADVVMIVGHSNSLPAVIKAFGGPDVKIDDADYDSFFVFVPTTGVLTRLRF